MDYWMRDIVLQKKINGKNNMPISCPTNSKIKMVVLTSGKNENFVWYSILSKDNKPENLICKAMFNRLMVYFNKNPEIAKTVNVIYFYDNQTKTKIGEAKPRL